MAANKFATMLHNNCNKITVILIYALLEWILIILLLLNSFFSHLISKFIEFFGLKPSCILCTKFDRVFGSKNSLFDHLCGVHGAEISKLSCCRSYEKDSDFKSLCRDCAFYRPVESGEERNRCCCQKINKFDDDDDQEVFGEEKTEYLETFRFSHSDERDDEMDMQDSDGFICIELIDAPSVASQKTNISRDVEEEDEDERKFDECTIRDGDIDRCRQIFSGAAFASRNREDELDSFPDVHAKGSETSETQIDDNDSLTKEHLKTTIKAQQEALSALYAELEEERNAAAIAANETMAMITKLQQEKANIQIEALQYQRMMDEQAEYDQEAMHLINDILIKREKEKLELKRELALYHNKALDHDEAVKSEIEYNLEENEISLEELKFLEAKLFALHDNETLSYCNSALSLSSLHDESHFNATDNESGHV